MRCQSYFSSMKWRTQECRCGPPGDPGPRKLLLAAAAQLCLCWGGGFSRAVWLGAAGKTLSSWGISFNLLPFKVNFQFLILVLRSEDGRQLNTAAPGPLVVGAILWRQAPFCGAGCNRLPPLHRHGACCRPPAAEALPAAPQTPPSVLHTPCLGAQRRVLAARLSVVPFPCGHRSWWTSRLWRLCPLRRSLLTSPVSSLRWGDQSSSSLPSPVPFSSRSSFSKTGSQFVS